MQNPFDNNQFAEIRRDIFEESFRDIQLPAFTLSCDVDLDSLSTDFTSPSSAETEDTKPPTPLRSESRKIKKQNTHNCTQRVPSKKGLWTLEEDNKLIDLVAKYGYKWSKISKMMCEKNRKQLRDRYMNALKPDINCEEWTEEEYDQLIVLHKKYGNRWRDIAASIPGRTENQVKNHFYWLKRRPPSKESEITKVCETQIQRVK